jgi:hypothetical protein
MICWLTKLHTILCMWVEYKSETRRMTESQTDWQVMMLADCEYVNEWDLGEQARCTFRMRWEIEKHDFFQILEQFFNVSKIAKRSLSSKRLAILF